MAGRGCGGSRKGYDLSKSSPLCLLDARPNLPAAARGEGDRRCDGQGYGRAHRPRFIVRGSQSAMSGKTMRIAMASAMIAM